MNVDLFIKKVPQVIKELISREAANNRRSINQEAIALLEEALVQRVGAIDRNKKSIQQLLEDYVAATRRTPFARSGEAGTGASNGAA